MVEIVRKGEANVFVRKRTGWQLGLNRVYAVDGKNEKGLKKRSWWLWWRGSATEDLGIQEIYRRDDGLTHAHVLEPQVLVVTEPPSNKDIRLLASF